MILGDVESCVILDVCIWFLTHIGTPPDLALLCRKNPSVSPHRPIERQDRLYFTNYTYGHLDAERFCIQVPISPLASVGNKIRWHTINTGVWLTNAWKLIESWECTDKENERSELENFRTSLNNLGFLPWIMMFTGAQSPQGSLSLYSGHFPKATFGLGKMPRVSNSKESPDEDWDVTLAPIITSWFLWLNYDVQWRIIPKVN